jgi:hypothetical protein
MTAILQAAFRYLAPVPEQTPPLLQKTSLWFRVPLELREQIYSDLFAEHALSPLYISPTEGTIFADPVAEGTHHTALLRTCKAIHAEALPILYATHNINLLVSDPLVLRNKPAPPSSTGPMSYRPQTPVCSRRYMLWLLQRRLTHVTIYFRMTSVSPHTLIVQKLAWLLEMLRRREKKLARLKLHVLDNLCAASGCCVPADYVVGWRWDVYPKVVVVAASRGGGCCKAENCGCKLLDARAEDWEAVVSMSEGRLSMKDRAPDHWERLSEDLCSVREVLEENQRWWKINGSVDVWDSIVEDPHRYYW